MNNPGSAERPAALQGKPSVPSLQRVLDIIAFFDATQRPATLSAIAVAVGLPKSSCVLLLQTLISNGYLYEVAPRMGYYPTRRWLDTFSRISARDPVVERARPVLQYLRDETSESVIFARRAGDVVVYLEVLDSSEAIRYAARPGDTKPMHATATGKAILANLPEPERRAVLARVKRTALTPRTIVDRAILEKDLADGLARGWWLSLGETEADLTGVSTCVFFGAEPYAVVAAGLTSRVEGRLEQIGKLLVRACATIDDRASGARTPARFR